MGRMLRLDPAGGWHHVMNRGVAHQNVFLAARDGRTFQSLLAEGHEEFGVEVHAFCFMTNHFHLLVHCPDAGLSEFMQLVGSRYTRYLNERLGRDGPIFRGRFRSLLIDSEQYLACAGRYIHRNPLDIRPAVALDEYRWSSFRYYCGRAESPSWLHLSTLGAMHDGSEAIREFVESDWSGSSGSVAWAIATAIAECSEEISARPKVDRTIATLMLTDAPGRIVAELEAMLAFPNPGARAAAVRRAHQRAAELPLLVTVTRRARELAC